MSDCRAMGHYSTRPASAENRSPHLQVGVGPHFGFPALRAVALSLLAITTLAGFVWAWMLSHPPIREIMDLEIKRMFVSTGVISFPSKKMVITDQSDCKRGSPLIIEGLAEGDYQVKFEMGPHETAPKSQIVSKVIITQGTLKGTTRQDSYSAAVDTGHLMFADSTIHDLGVSSENIRKLLTTVLESPETLSLLLKSPGNGNLGAIAGSGMGDGQYPVEVRRGDQGGFELICDYTQG
jgi:hypothetical protein